MSQKPTPNTQYQKPNDPRATCHVLSAMVVALLVLAGLTFANAQGATTLALLPFENVSGSIRGPAIIMPLIEQVLKEKSYKVVSPEKLEPFLFRHRIRNTGMLSRSHLSALRQEFAIELAMVGSVDLYYESAENPQWGLSSRVLSAKEGKIIWAESAGLTGDDFTGMLGLGMISSGDHLAEKVVGVLFRTLPAAEEPFPVPEARGPSGSRAGYRSPELDADPPMRVAVLPFENASERKGAGLILTDIFTPALVQKGRFEVVEPGEVHEALIAVKATPFGAIDFQTLGGLRERTGVDAVFVGTVYTYNEGIKREATTAPEVSVDARMIDAESHRILWFAGHARKGEDYRVVLDFGIIRSMVPLALEVVTEMLESL